MLRLGESTEAKTLIIEKNYPMYAYEIAQLYERYFKHLSLKLNE